MLDLLYLIFVGVVVGFVLDLGARHDIPIGILLISVLVLGMARILLEGSRVAFLAIGATQAVVALGCGIADLVAGHTKSGACLVVVFLCLLPALAKLRRRASGPA